MTEILIASDHGGYKLKNILIEHLKDNGYSVRDLGCYSDESCDYPIYAHKMANEVIESGNKGILICGTGIGMSIAANRHDGIRASHCTDTFSARMTRMHNNSNVLCLGERISGVGIAKDIVDVWLTTEFVGGRHQKRIELI